MITRTAHVLLRPLPYPRRKPYIAKPKRAKAMTLAVSIRTPNGVVLCAESQITEGQSKLNEVKISNTVWTPDMGLAIVGAGWWDYVKMAYEELSKNLLNAESDDAVETIKSTVTGLYETHIKAYPSDYDKPRVSLLTVVVRRNEGVISVIKSVDTATHNAMPFDTIGIGRDLAQYIGSKLYRPDLEPEQAAALGTYIIEEAKKNVEGCGGLSQILWISNESLKYVPIGCISALRAWFGRSARSMPDIRKLPPSALPILYDVLKT